MGALLVVVLLVLAVATASRWLDVAQAPIAAVQAARPLVGLAAVATMVVALAAQRTWEGAAAVALVAVHVAIWLPTRLADPAVPGSHDVVVMASNMEYGSADASTLVELVEARQVDVLVLLEVTPAGQEHLSTAGLSALLPEQVGRAREGAGGTLVMSRLPLEEMPGGATGVFDQPVVRAETDAGPMLVFAAHPYPPFRAARWREELAEIDRWAREQPPTSEGGVPVVVAGDLNASADHPAFRALTSGPHGLTDAQRADGAGWVRTWPTKRPIPPVVHIDHVLVRDLDVLGTGTEPVPGTDHRAVWARLTFP